MHNFSCDQHTAAVPKLSVVVRSAARALRPRSARAASKPMLAFFNEAYNDLAQDWKELNEEGAAVMATLYRDNDDDLEMRQLRELEPFDDESSDHTIAASLSILKFTST